MGKIKDYFELNPSKNTNNYTDYINYIDTSSATKGILHDITYLDSNFPSRANRCVKYDDILYSSVRPNLRHYYHYKLNYENVVASTGYVLLRNKNKELYSSEFLYYFLGTDSVVKYLSNIAELSQSTFPSFSAKDLGKIELPAFDFINQKRIADILTTYDNLIGNNNKRIKLLEQMAENLYKEWFVRFRFPGYEDVKFENGIPIGWKIKRIKDFGQVITGKTPSTEISSNYGDKYLFIKTPDMHDNMYVIDSSEKLSERGNDVQKLKKLPRWSIMVSCIGTGGVVSINSKEAHTNQQINSIVLHDKNNIEWLFFVCKSLKTTIEMFGATGSTMTNLSKGKFENLKILEPNLELINKYHMYTHDIFKEIEKLMYSNENLINQRDLLLPRLMSGKLEV